MKRIPHPIVSEVLRRSFRSRGLSSEHTEYVVDGLVTTSLRGIDTHGIRLFPTYLQELDGGRAVARPELRIETPAAAVRALDAGGALGHVAGTVAADEAVALAEDTGVAVVVVSNSNHFGAASCFTLRMARAGVIGLCLSNADALVAPHGGSRAMFGTNPLSLAFEVDDEGCFCIDMATSQVAYSRVRANLGRGEPIPEGWALDAAGVDAAESSSEQVASLLPLGGHKGQCLSMLVSILCGVLAKGPLDHELSHLFSPPFDHPRQIAHFFVALQVSSFGDPAELRRRLRHYLSDVRAVPARPGFDPVVVPGDLEAEEEQARKTLGIPMTEQELEALRSAAGRDAADLVPELG